MVVFGGGEGIILVVGRVDGVGGDGMLLRHQRWLWRVVIHP